MHYSVSNVGWQIRDTKVFYCWAVKWTNTTLTSPCILLSSTEPSTISYKLRWRQDIYIWVIQTRSAHKRYDLLMLKYSSHSCSICRKVVWQHCTTKRAKRDRGDITTTQHSTRPEQALFLKSSLYSNHTKAHSSHCHIPLLLSVFEKTSFGVRKPGKH